MFADRLPDTLLSELPGALRGTDFPATRDEIVEMARVNGASPVLVDRLADLLERSFDTHGEVHDALGLV